MKWIDYREKLGIGFNDKAKFEILKNKLLLFINRLDNLRYGQIDKSNLFYYFQMLGEQALYGMQLSSVNFSLAASKSTIELISKFIAFINTSIEFIPDPSLIKTTKNYLLCTLEETNITYEILEDDDGVFVFPKGAKELDDVLVSQPLEWLKQYPKTYKAYCNALHQYSEEKYTRDIADNFRKTLEEFFKEFNNNTKNLDNNIPIICKFLGEHNAEPELSGMIKTLLGSYKNLNDRAIKHNDNLDKNYLEFLMYQTGIFIRTLILVKNSQPKSSD